MNSNPLMEDHLASDETLLSLLRVSLETSAKEAIFDGGPAYPLPLSFDEPFDDSAMEPLPFKSHLLSINAELVSSQPSKPSFKQEFNDPGMSQNLVSFFFDPITEILQTKRSSDAILSDIYTPSRSKRQRTSLDDSSEEMLMRFRPYQDRQWRAMFQKLVQYKLQHGHCCVPHSYQDDQKLARWVKRQRYQHKKFEDKDPTSTMTVDRIEELSNIGFVWHSHASAWQTKLNELKEFKQRKGHCNVPSNYPTNPPLAAWIRCQRRHYRLWKTGSNSAMTHQRYELLESLGFAFENHKLV